MRIIVVSGIYPPDIGGPATHASALLAELLSRGHDAQVLTLGEEGVADTNRVTRLARRRWWPFRSAAIVIWLRRHRREFEVVYATGLPLPAVVGARLARRPVVLKIVGDHAWERGRRLGVTSLSFDDFQQCPPKGLRITAMRAVRSVAVGHADAVIAPGAYLARAVEQWANGVHVEVVPNGVSRPPPRRRTAQPRLQAVFIGRLVTHKRVDLLIDALILAPEVDLDVIGDGPELLTLRQHANELGIGHRVRFPGALEHERAMHRLVEADVLVSASSYEGLPHTHLEALVAGVPVVTSAAGGSAEAVVDGVNGLIVHPPTAARFAETLIALHQDRDLLDQLSKQATEMGEEWRFDRCADRLEAIFARVQAPNVRAVFVANGRLAGLTTPSVQGKLGLHRSHLTTTWLVKGRPGVEHDGKDLAVRLPALKPAPLGSLFFYGVAPFMAIAMTAGRRHSAIVCQSPFEASAVLAVRRALPRRLRPRVQVELHGDWETAARLYGGPSRRLVAPLADLAATWSLRNADRVRAVSHVLADRARAAGCRCPIDVHVAHSDYGEFLGRPPTALPDVPAAIYVGVLEATKGVDVLLRAWESVVHRIPDATLLVIGGGREEAGLRAQVVGSALEGCVRFQSPMPRHELPAHIDDSWCLVLPSRSEGLGRVVLEAMARARAVVASRVGGLVELVADGCTGWLVDPDDPVALAGRLVQVLSDRDAATAMGVEGRRRALGRDPVGDYDAGIARLAEWIGSR
jgi:glycosyltransferase involved in cell wall biosynthesis